MKENSIVVNQDDEVSEDLFRIVKNFISNENKTYQNIDSEFLQKKRKEG